MEENNNEKKKVNQGTYVGLGLCFGVALGIAFNKLAIGMSLGLVIGAILENRKGK